MYVGDLQPRVGQVSDLSQGSLRGLFLLYLFHKAVRFRTHTQHGGMSLPPPRNPEGTLSLGEEGLPPSTPL